MYLASRHIAKFLGSFLFVASCVLKSGIAFGEPPIVEIHSLYTEYLVGEVLMLHIRVFNPIGNPAMSVVNLSVTAKYAGSFETELVEPTGNVLPFPQALRMVRNFPAVFDTDLIRIASGTEWRAHQNVFQASRMSGKHTVRVTYRPNWKAPPEITREIGVNVIGAEAAILESKVSPPGYEGNTIEISKVRTADGYWLYYRSRPRSILLRLVQINEKATFSVSERQSSQKSAGGVCVVTYELDGERRTLSVQYPYGTPLDGQLSPKD
jgi:hypothetical protein